MTIIKFSWSALIALSIAMFSFFKMYRQMKQLDAAIEFYDANGNDYSKEFGPKYYYGDPARDGDEMSNEDKVNKGMPQAVLFWALTGLLFTVASIGMLIGN